MPPDPLPGWPAGVPEWQPAATPPPIDTLVLTYGENGQCVAYFSGWRWRQPFKTYYDDIDPEGVTHWLPLPFPPPPD